MTKEELNFNYIYGTIFSADTTAEYAESLATILNEQGQNYERNLAEQAGKACTKLGNALRRLLTKNMNDEQKAIALAAVDHHKDLVYDFFLLDCKQQQRVKGLIAKMKKEAASMEVVREEVAA
ncbi:hypothetical protein ACFSJU_14945 [Paradesertivirga mongoliensis]|uniref:Uncharacterized protein n=1 Tax=Paradesertivirga mongoliensis TaxID=2100740 RepID=A0ABW4ZPQ5_9SPHI|nr:hypothetical protein [Pedobacter mongoliensis]